MIQKELTKKDIYDVYKLKSPLVSMVLQKSQRFFISTLSTTL